MKRTTKTKIKVILLSIVILGFCYGTKEDINAAETRTHINEIRLQMDLKIDEIKYNDAVKGTGKDDSYEVLSKTPQYIKYNHNTHWAKYNADGFPAVYEEKYFSEGDFEYMICLSVEDDYIDSYYVDGETKIYVNNVQWRLAGYGHGSDDNSTSVHALSPVITISKDKTAIEGVSKNVVEIDNVHFPDAVFRNYVERFDLNADGWLSEKEISQVEKIMIVKTNLADITGVEYFTALKGLFCYEDRIAKVDVSKNTELEMLSLHRNKLKKLDVTHNRKLKSLTCYENNIKELKLGDLPDLEWLHLTKNKIKKIDVSRCPSLVTFQIQMNPVSKLNLKNNKNLEVLWCYDCRLTSLDISKNKKLKELYCYGNRIKSLNTKKNKKLEKIRCHNNDFKKLDLRKNKKITYIFCDPGIDLKYVGHPQLLRTRYKSNKYGNLIYRQS